MAGVTTHSEDALNYQEQVTGQPAWRVYEIDEVEFDGFTGRELQEAKGPNYVNFFKKDGTPQDSSRRTDGRTSPSSIRDQHGREHK